MLPILLTFWPFMEKVFKNNKKYLGNCSKEDVNWCVKFVYLPFVSIQVSL